MIITIVQCIPVKNCEVCIVLWAHQILSTMEYVTPYTTNAMGEIQTLRQVLLCI